jgi:hypothetical protein
VLLTSRGKLTPATAAAFLGGGFEPVNETFLAHRAVLPAGKYPYGFSEARRSKGTLGLGLLGFRAAIRPEVDYTSNQLKIWCQGYPFPPKVMFYVRCLTSLDGDPDGYPEGRPRR